MFSDEILEEILMRQETRSIPCEHKYIMIHVIADVLETKNLLKDRNEVLRNVYE